MPTVADIHTESRALLNDAGNALFSDSALLPFTKKAYQELQDELINNGISTQFGATENVTIAAGISSYDAILNLGGSGFLYPLHIEEKAVGESDDMYVPIKEEPADIAVENFITGERLGYWNWRGALIYFRPAATDRVIRLEYISIFAALSVVGDTIKTINSQTFLAARIAAIAALVIGGNPDRASLYQKDAEYRLSVIINQAVKRNQSLPTRRVPFSNR